MGVMYDLVVRGGTLVDGLGGEPFSADVAVDGGVITEIGRVGGRAAREVDADGALVTPGFVDVHAHYDGQATWDSQLAPSSWHGVTTVVMGNCGVGFAPVRATDHERLIQLMEGVEDIPGAALHEGITWEWESFDEYLGALDRRRRDVDVCALVPHGAVRLFVMGERGAAREPATPEEIGEMGRLVRDGVAAGAFGFSTSRTLNHRTSGGDRTPTFGAAGAELIGIARAMRETGRGAFEVVSDFDDLDEEFDVFARVAGDTGARTFISLNQNKLGGYRKVLDRIAEAAGSGLPVQAQVAVRPIGVLFGLDTTIDPFILNPVWAPYRSGDRAARLAALTDPDVRRRLMEAAGEPSHVLGGYARFFPLGDPPEYEPPPEASVAAIAERQGRHPVEVLCDLMAADGGAGFVYFPIFNYDAGDLEAQRELLTHPNTIIGLADGGAHVGTICDGSFPTTLLAHWGRDRVRGPRLELPWLVKAQTADTGDAYGLQDRGRLRVGLRADLNVIDFERLRLRTPEVVHDLPAGGRRLVQRADGYVATVVAGEVTYRGGEPTGALPGRLVRSGIDGART
jgi:N-acyl-D-aspartate/D-glutamate deacylase